MPVIHSGYPELNMYMQIERKHRPIERSQANHHSVMCSRSASFMPRQALRVFRMVRYTHLISRISSLPPFFNSGLEILWVLHSPRAVARDGKTPLSSHMSQNARFRSISIYFLGVSTFSSSFSKSCSMISFSVIFGVRRCKCSTSPPLSCHSMSLLNAPSVFEARS